MDKISINELTELFGEVIDLSRIRIDVNSILGEDIPVDSRDMLRILSRIEAKYKFRFELSEILTLQTIGDVLETVRHRLNTGE